jgi:hypothetical protein
MGKCVKGDTYNIIYFYLSFLIDSPVYSLLSTSGYTSPCHGNEPAPKAASSTSRTVLAKTNCVRTRTSFGTSCSTSFLFAHGRITLLAPARCAPNTFSLIPPTVETRPRSVICRRHSCQSEREWKGGLIFAHLTGHGSCRRDTLSRQKGYDRADLHTTP